MSKSLYQRYRPRTLDEVVGQDVIKLLLSQMAKRDLIPSAILFTGPYGVGKTVLAHTTVKMLNCLAPLSERACYQCASCEALNQECVDFIEIDAATHTGVDHIRQIQENCAYLPLQLRYKVYLIDEVHMLSRSAFDALLITLQSPPSHVKFLFATTRAEKVPETFLSRCMLLPLTRLSSLEIQNHLKSISTREGKSISDQLQAEIAACADGSLRQALSLLEPVLILDDEIQARAYLKILPRNACAEMLSAVLAGQPGRAVALWQSLYTVGHDEKTFFHQMSKLLTDCFLHGIGERMDPVCEELQSTYNLSLTLLINLWEIVISQMEALYFDCSHLVSTTLIMMSLVEEDANLLPKLKKSFSI